MSFNVIATISFITEVVVLSAISLTLANAFSEGKLKDAAARILHLRRR